MSYTDSEHPIQPSPGVGDPPVSLQGTGESPRVEDWIPRGQQRQRTLAAGMAFGALVGLPAGAVVGAACCWLTDQFDFLWYGVLIGALAGPFAGALVGLKERKARGDLVRPDIATFVCVVFSLLPALLMGVQAIGIGRGSFSLYLLLGAIFVGPMIGLVTGGMLDRAFEAYLKKSWGVALPFAVAGAAVCVGLVYLIDSAAYGPDPKEVGRETRRVLLSEWRRSHDRGEVTVDRMTLVRTGRRTYTGSADVIFAGQPSRLALDVLADGETIEVRWTVEPPKGRP